MGRKELRNPIGVFKRAFAVLSSVRFLCIILALIIFACMLGTVILQDVPEEMSVEAYGKIGYRLLSALQFTCVFRSLWFKGLLFLLGLSLLSCIVKEKPTRLANIGFLLIHSSIMVILVGALINSIWAEKGEALLRIGLLMLAGGFTFSFLVEPLVFKGKVK